jgi:hypothetical protein
MRPQASPQAAAERQSIVKKKLKVAAVARGVRQDGAGGLFSDKVFVHIAALTIRSPAWLKDQAASFVLRG